MSPLPGLLNTLGSFAPSVALLWLAGALCAQSRDGTGLSSRGLTSMALALAALGLWWPLQLAGTVVSGNVADSTAWQFALPAISLGLPVIAGYAALSAAPWLSRGRAGAAAGAALLAVLAMAAVSSAPGDPGTQLRTALGALVLAAALVALAFPFPNQRLGSQLRVAAAVAAAAALVLAPVPLRSAQDAWTHPAMGPTLALVLFGAGLLSLLRQRQPSMRLSQRLPIPTVETLRDNLTRLPTRAQFETQLAATVVQCDASGSRLALLFINLDGFKPVNDTFGHNSGDRVLQAVGKRLKACADSHDVIARVGGDEFLMLLVNAGTPDEVSHRARKIVGSLAQPIDIEEREVGIGCSIGIAFYPDDGQHAKLIARADSAMYAAKRAGGGGFCFFTTAMEDDARERFDLLRDLRLALERKELELYYQPKIDAATGKVTAAEALLRWQHPTRGMVPPSMFIPIAERFGLIRSIGQWVIDDACRQARVWQDKGLKMRVAINLSAAQMRQEDIVARIEGALARHRVDPSLLTCEITESVAMEDTRATQATFRELGTAGIHLSIDDFGTGHSSLAYLRKLPAEELKIDRSFVLDVEFSADARAVVEAVVKLAHALSLKVVAEGVENEHQQQILVQLGCDELQGFLFARPMTARALLRWALDDRKAERKGFAASLFANTRDDYETYVMTDFMNEGTRDRFQSTRPDRSEFAETDKQPLAVHTDARHVRRAG